MKSKKVFVLLLTVVLLMSIVSSPVSAGTATGLDSFSYTFVRDGNILDQNVTVSSSAITGLVVTWILPSQAVGMSVINYGF